MIKRSGKKIEKRMEQVDNFHGQTGEKLYCADVENRL